MSTRQFPLFWLIYVSAIFFIISDAEKQEQCHPSSCGGLHDITYPFRLRNDLNNCVDSPTELSCEQNQTFLHLNSGRYYVKAINYANTTIRVVDPGLLNESCPSMPLYFLSSDNFSTGDGFLSSMNSTVSYHISYDSNFAIFINCKLPVDSPDYVNISCKNSSVPLQYVTVGEDVLDNLQPSCGVSIITPTVVDIHGNLSYSLIHDQLKSGFEISWIDHKYIPNDDTKGDTLKSLKIAGGILGGRTILVVFVLLSYQCYRLGSKACDATEKSMLSFLCYLRHRLWRRDMSKDDATEKSLVYWLCYSCLWVSNMYNAAKKSVVSYFWYLHYRLLRLNQPKDDVIENFLNKYKSQMPTRYSYSDLKKMTMKFKDKLGHGGYGSVFKGMLSDGHLVAVKMLNGSKGKGQDFINEVATIGRIHHVNVVHLIGFCSDGSKRALVYDFMENGSLDIYTFGKKDGLLLSWDKMHEIAIGVARGIEYLHRGCDLQILHFDIKPHNILLDENLAPKISDFGLAKFYPRDHNTVTLTAARGTMGYIAPELFYKNIGSVTYKADVYSFGMLLMEMAGRRRNIDANAANTSQIYYPSWIYDQLESEREVDIGDASEHEKKIAKKMIMVALWCIQLMPSERPSMSKVVEMLEGDVEHLQMPPKPFLSPQEMPDEDLPVDMTYSDESIQPLNSRTTTSFEQEHTSPLSTMLSITLEAISITVLTL